MPRLIYADALHRELVVEMVKCVRMSEETKMTMAERVLNKLDEAPTIALFALLFASSFKMGTGRNEEGYDD